MKISRPVLMGMVTMASVVVLSNILVQHLLGNWLTYGALTYPFAFLVTDIMNRKFGAKGARDVVIVGFIVGVVCSLIASQLTNADGSTLTTLRIAIGSGLAFLTAQLLDVSIFNKLREGSWWRAPLMSSVIGSGVDTFLFFTIAFSATLTFIDPSDPNGWAAAPVPLFGFGPVAPLWISLASADLTVKLSLALIVLVPFRLLTKNHA